MLSIWLSPDSCTSPCSLEDDVIGTLLSLGAGNARHCYIVVTRWEKKSTRSMTCTKLLLYPSQSVTQGVIKKTIPLFHGQWSSLTEELPGYIVYTSAVAKISQHCLYSICDVWVTSCLEKKKSMASFFCLVRCASQLALGKGEDNLMWQYNQCNSMSHWIPHPHRRCYHTPDGAKGAQAYIGQMTAKNSQ